MKTTSTRIEVITTAYDRLRYVNGWNVDIVKTSSRKSKTLEFGIMCRSAGTQTPQQAREYQKQLTKTIKLVEKLNALEIEVEFGCDPVIDSDEQFNSFVGVMRDYILNEDGASIAHLVETFLRYQTPEEPEEEDEDEDDHYTPSATHGDYSPSCPWKAPGMSISDFI